RGGRACRGPGRGVRGGGASHCGGTGGRLVPRPHGVRAARPRAPQHPRRPGPPRDAGSHQRHGEDAGGVPAVRSRRLARGSGSLVRGGARNRAAVHDQDRKSTRLNSSHSQISYAVFCLKKKKKKKKNKKNTKNKNKNKTHNNIK